MSTVTFPFEHDVLAAQRGDRLAFTRLVDAYSGVVSAITLAIVRDVPTSEDVAQNVFVSAWGSLQNLRNPASFLPWLRQLARNQSKELVRARSRFSRRHAPWPEGGPPEVADGAVSARELLVEREEHAALVEALENLPDETRELITLYYREGNSARQVGELLDLSEDAVKKRLERARTALQAAVLQRFESAVRKTAPGAAFTAAVVAAIAVSSGTAQAATAATTTAAAKKVAGGGAFAKLSAAFTSYGVFLGSVLCGIAATMGLVAWLALRPAAPHDVAAATMHAATTTTAASSSASDDSRPRYPHATKDRAKRDELRAKLLTAYAQAEAQAHAQAEPGAGSADVSPAAPARGQRQTNDIEEFGRFVTQAIREDFVPMAKACAKELAVRRPGTSGKAFVAFELLGDEKIGGVVNSAEIVRDKSTIVDAEFETCVRESLYGVYFDPPPSSTRATLNFEVKVLGGGDGGIDEDVEEFHLKDRRGEQR